MKVWCTKSYQILSFDFSQYNLDIWFNKLTHIILDQRIFTDRNFSLSLSLLQSHSLSLTHASHTLSLSLIVSLLAHWKPIHYIRWVDLDRSIKKKMDRESEREREGHTHGERERGTERDTHSHAEIARQ